VSIGFIVTNYTSQRETRKAVYHERRLNKAELGGTCKPDIGKKRVPKLPYYQSVKKRGEKGYKEFQWKWDGEIKSFSWG